MCVVKDSENYDEEEDKNEDTHDHHQYHRAEINDNEEEGDHGKGEDSSHPPVLPPVGDTHTHTLQLCTNSSINTLDPTGNQSPGQERVRDDVIV